MIDIMTKILIGMVAAMHLYFCYFEIFRWESAGPKLFKSNDSDFYKKTKAMMANQGLYNLFLAAGLIWSLLSKNHTMSFYLAIFFLSCVVIAGIFGSITVSRRIFYIQALPALIALILLHF